MKLSKCVCFSLIFIMTLLINIDDVLCLEGIVNGTSVRVRSGAGTSYSEVGMTNLPSVYTLLDEDKIKTDDGTDSNCSYWHKISYNNKTDYICSTFLTIKTSESVSGGTGNFLEDLKKFPVSYREKIEALHLLYPNATFTALNTGLNWDDAVNGENYISTGNPKNEARNLMQTKYDGYKSTNSILYSWSTNLWNTNISGGGSTWYAAHEDVISYYMDPRNFLTYNSSFMFLNHGYSNTVNYNEKAINEILKNSFMTGLTNDGKNSFAKAFLDAGKESGISPYYLAARVIQEIGRSKTRSAYVDGKYNGYYNYYNIDAAGNNHLANALLRAKKEGWDNDYKAIIGGAKFIADGYVSTGQSTLYLEKWDVVDGGNGYYNHQYMQNIQAPVTEANTLYTTYIENELTTSNMEFLIPVYNNMPTSTSLPNIGNPNNYLKEITINGYKIDGFDRTKLEYNYNVSSTTSKVEVGASKIASTSSVSGVGTIDIKDEKYKHTITVKAGNGSVRKYVINFTKDDSKPISVSDIISSKGYVSDGVNISGINPGSTVSDLIKNIKGEANNINVSVTNVDGKEKNDQIMATGDKITVTSGSETKTYNVLIYGDLTGDGKISSSDYVYIKNYIMGNRILNSIQKLAGDINKDGKISSSDYVFVKNHIMGTNLINQ